MKVFASSNELSRVAQSKRWFGFLQSLGAGLQIGLTVVAEGGVITSLPDVCPSCGAPFPRLSQAEVNLVWDDRLNQNGDAGTGEAVQAVPLPLWDGLCVVVRECPCQNGKNVHSLSRRAATAGRLIQSFQATLAESIQVGQASAELTALRQLNMIVLSMFHGETMALAKACDLVLSALVVLLGAKASWLVRSDGPAETRLLVRGDRAAAEPFLGLRVEDPAPPGVIGQTVNGSQFHGYLAAFAPEDPERATKLLPMMAQECAIIFEIDFLFNLVKAQLASVLGAFNEPILLLNRKREAIFANKAAAALFGEDAIDMIGRSAQSLEVPWLDQLKDDHSAAPGSSSGFFGHDSRGRILDWRIIPLGVEADREIAGWLVMAEDRTEFYRWQETGRRAENYSTITSIMGTLAHELRNPLAAVKALLQLARRKREPEKIEGYIDLVLREIDRLSTLVNEFLQMNKTKPLNLQRVEPSAFLQELLPLMAAEAAEAGVELAREFATVPAVQVDPEQLTQVLLNLNRNAVEAAGRGGRVELSLASDDRWVVMRFRDSGPGITAENTAKLFTPFFTTKERGTGLGLAIAKSIIDRHRGRITAENSPHGGAVFSVMLPALAKQETSKAVDVLILIADDMASYPIEQTLQASGFTTAIANDLTTAVETGYLPGAVLLDETVHPESIRRVKRVWPGTRPIILGNAVNLGERFLPKPLDYARLIDEARRAVGDAVNRLEVK